MTWRDHVPRAVLQPLIERPVFRSVPDATRFYVALVLAANSSGRILRTRARLARDLQVTEPEIDAGLSALADAGLVRIESPAPFLVLWLPFWSGSPSSVVEKPELSAGNPDAQPDSNSYSHTAIALQNLSGDGGLGEGVRLLDLAREILGDSAEVELAAILKNHPVALVERALRKVQKTPADEIRKSKPAFFRFLVGRYSRDPHAYR